MRPTRAELLQAIQATPRGLTSIELARRFGCAVGALGSNVSRLHAYGFIARQEIPDNRKAFRWMPKEARS